MCEDVLKKVVEYMAVCRKEILQKRHEDIPEILYHYTAVENLHYFFEPNADILVTHVAVQNDKDEIRTGFRLFCDVLDKKYGNSDAIGFLWQKFEQARTDTTRMPYVFSLSADSDSLPQWRAYTDQHAGGYAIGFLGRSILRAVTENMAGDEHRGWIECFMPCAYEGKDDIRHVVETGIKTFEDDFDSFFRSDKPIDERMLEGNAVINLLILMSSFIKNGGFEAEREWRIVVKPGVLSHEIASAEKHQALWESQVQILGGKPRTSTCLKNLMMSIPPLIADVAISPHGDNDSLMTNCLALLRIAGLYFMPHRMSCVSYVSR